MQEVRIKRVLDRIFHHNARLGAGKGLSRVLWFDEVTELCGDYKKGEQRFGLSKH